MHRRQRFDGQLGRNDRAALAIRAFTLICNRYNIGFAPNLVPVTENAKNDFINLLSSDDFMMKPDALETYAEIIVEISAEAQRATWCSSDRRKVSIAPERNHLRFCSKSDKGHYDSHV